MEISTKRREAVDGEVDGQEKVVVDREGGSGYEMSGRRQRLVKGRDSSWQS